MRSAALGEVPHELRAVGASSALLSERLPLVQSRSRKTTSFPIPLFTVGIRPSLSLGLISVLNISLRNFQGRCLLFNYQGSLFCFRISATTSIAVSYTHLFRTREVFTYTSDVLIFSSISYMRFSRYIAKQIFYALEACFHKL